VQCLFVMQMVRELLVAVSVCYANGEGAVGCSVCLLCKW